MDGFLDDGPAGAAATILLAPGAGAGAGSSGMAALAGALAAAGLRVLRFDFGYRREGRRLPPRAERLVPEVCALAATLAAADVRPLVIGGKSMGGRVASMAADRLHAAGRIAGLLCIGYPFHPPGRPDHLRISHLAALETPALFCQGTRDPFGTQADVEGYPLSPAIELFWLEDGDHDLRPRARGTGHTLAGHRTALAARTAQWVARLTASRAR